MLKLTSDVAQLFYFCLVSFCLRTAFSIFGGDSCTNTVHCFISHINSVYGALHCALLLMNTKPSQKVFSFKPSHQFTFLEEVDRFDVEVVDKSVFRLLREFSRFIRNQLHLKFPT